MLSAIDTYALSLNLAIFTNSPNRQIKKFAKISRYTVLWNIKFPKQCVTLAHLFLAMMALSSCQGPQHIPFCVFFLSLNLCLALLGGLLVALLSLLAQPTATTMATGRSRLDRSVELHVNMFW